MLTAIAIPVFTTQLEKSREATDMANIRSAYAEVMSAYLEDNQAKTANVPLKSNTNDWKSDPNAEIAGVKAAEILGTGGAKSITVEIDVDGNAKIGGEDATSGFLSKKSS